MLHVFVLLFLTNGFYFWKLLLQAARPFTSGFHSHFPLVKQQTAPMADRNERDRVLEQRNYKAGRSQGGQLLSVTSCETPDLPVSLICLQVPRGKADLHVNIL